MMKSHALELVANGYWITPIKSGAKRPLLKGWQTIVSTSKLARVWAQKYPENAVGILTNHTPAVDIDCLHQDLVDGMVDFITRRLGAAPTRIGKAPKTLLVYQTEEPFTKVKSSVWVDENGDLQAVEILGVGQQFVAFGIHPDTKRPYQWTTDDTPENCHAKLDLPTITLEDARAIVRHFDSLVIASRPDWTRKNKATLGVYSLISEGVEEEDQWVIDSLAEQYRWEGSYEELELLMEQYPPEDDYDRWYKVLAALKMAEREPDEFKEIAREWSARAQNYSDEGFEEKWTKGAFHRTSGLVFTCTSIRRQVESIHNVNQLSDVILPAFQSCTNFGRWEDLAKAVREIPEFGPAREAVIEAAGIAYKRIVGKALSAAKLEAKFQVDVSLFDPPEWVEPLIAMERDGDIYDRLSDCYFNRWNFDLFYLKHVSKMGLNAAPSKVVMGIFDIPRVFDAMYWPAMHGDFNGGSWVPSHCRPGDPQLFHFAGRDRFNTFDPKSIPVAAPVLNARVKSVGRVIEHFFRVQFPDAMEFTVVMDFLSWVISHPEQRINYCLLWQGGEGSGKTMVKTMLAKCLGDPNVHTVANAQVHSQYSGWQAGGLVKVIEEIFVKDGRYDVMDTLKEPITNDMLSVSDKYVKSHETINSASYIAFTNHAGAVPITAASRRFAVVRSSMRSNADVKKHLQSDPEYFERFISCYRDHPAAVRRFWLDWPQSKTFRPLVSAAPDTASKNAMMESAEDSLTALVRDWIAEGNNPWVCSDGVVTAGLRNALREEPAFRLVADNTRRIEMVLTSLGFSRIESPTDGKGLRMRFSCGRSYVYLPSESSLRGADPHAIVEWFSRRDAQLGCPEWRDSSDDEEI